MGRNLEINLCALRADKCRCHTNVKCEILQADDKSVPFHCCFTRKI